MSETPATSPSPAPELAYAPRLRHARLRRWRWRIVLLTVMLTIAVPVYLHRETLIRRATWLYWSHRCASHQMPTGVKLLVSDPQRVQQLLTNDPDYTPPVSGAWPPTTRPGAAVYVPLAWRKFAAMDGRSATLNGPVGSRAIAFMGSLRRPDGVSRLVVVQGRGTNAHALLRDIELLVLPHPGITDEPPPPQVSREKFYGISELVLPAALHAGQTDPNDPSHVVFEFVVRGGMNYDEVQAKGTLDAYFQNDDSLRFSLRDDPELSRRRVKLLQETLRSVPATPTPFVGR
jgi:hypothetical protein